VTKNASDQPFLDLGKAFTAFFEGLKNGKRKGRPRFKSKKRSKASFYLANDQCELGDHRIWIPKLGWVNMAENLRFQGKVTGARITKTAGRGTKTKHSCERHSKSCDRPGIRLHRRVKGSKNREKARRQVARLHYRITCLRDDVLHKLTTHLAECYGMVGIEDLNLKGLLKNRKLARSLVL
jgi:putative transposase